MHAPSHGGGTHARTGAHTRTPPQPSPTHTHAHTARAPQALGADFEMQDGERLPLAVKELGSSDLYPQSLQASHRLKLEVMYDDAIALSPT